VENGQEKGELRGVMCRKGQVQTVFRAHTFTADPSYEQYLKEHESNRVQQGDRIMVPLQEIGGQYRQSWMDACIEKADHWVMIARKGGVSTEQIRALEQHGKLAGRVKPASRGCLEKGWSKKGERKRIKGRFEHFVWEKRDREKDKGKEAEDAEVVELETMDTAGGIKACNRFQNIAIISVIPDMVKAGYRG